MTTMAEYRTRAAGEHEAAVRRHVCWVASSLSASLADLSVELGDELVERVPELGGDPAMLPLLRANIEANLVAILQSLEHDISRDRQEPPTAVIEYARRLAQRGVSVFALVRVHGLIQQLLFHRIFDASFATGGPEDVRTDAHQRLVHHILDFVDWISQRVVIAYEEERAAWLANPSRAREVKVREILDGGVVDIGMTERDVGYRLRGHHVAVVGCVREEMLQTGPRGSSERAIRDFAQKIDGGTPLIISHDRAATWAWVPVSPAWQFDESLVAWRSGDESCPMLAVGSRRVGIDGFRQSHEEALRVQRLALLGGVPYRRVISHDEPGVAATALLAQDLNGARAWITGVLGDLGRDDEDAARLRRTVLTLLRHDMNYTATAESMSMHKNSIKYRLGSAESLLGRPVTADNRLEVYIALTACEWLGWAAAD